MKPQDHSSYSNHDEVWLLLPWYLNGSLKSSDLELVKQHLRVCLVCRKEVAEQGTLYHQLQHTPSVEISSKPSFERLMSRIHDEEKIQRQPNGNQAVKQPWFAEWRTRFLEVLAPKRLGFALAAGLLILSIPWMLQRTPLDTAPSYHTVANQGSLGQFGKKDIQVVFVDHLAESEIDKILTSINGQIVDGPTKRGVYTIRIISSGGSELSLSKFLEKLRGNKAVVFAEPALPPEDDRDGKGG